VQRPHAAALVLALALWSPSLAEEEAPTCGPAEVCPPPAGEKGPPRAAAPPPGLTVYWGVGCPHCEEARPFVERLAAEGLRVEWIEVRRDPAGRARFAAEVERLGLAGAGIPLFVSGDRAVVGFLPGESEGAIRALAAGAAGGAAEVALPWIGAVDPRAVPLPIFTAAVGLLDGLNPCALYVLVVLLGILLHVGSRRRMALYGFTFVAVSGLVYLLFMTAWLGLFALGGLSRGLTAGLGVALAGMGLVNLKDAVWLRRGPTLSVPERARPGLFRRMREVASAASRPAALAGVVALAFVVNLVELGCTLGLPAMYTRVLSPRTDLGTAGRLGYLALYNLAYVVPLAAVVALFLLTLRRIVMGERTARLLKGVSGTLLLGFGLLFLQRPELLG
jgi:hypothetical protein